MGLKKSHSYVSDRRVRDGMAKAMCGRIVSIFAIGWGPYWWTGCKTCRKIIKRNRQ